MGQGGNLSNIRTAKEDSNDREKKKDLGGLGTRSFNRVLIDSSTPDFSREGSTEASIRASTTGASTGASVRGIEKSNTLLHFGAGGNYPSFQAESKKPHVIRVLLLQ